MIIYTPQLKCVFLHIPKAAGSSITKTLAKYLGKSREVYRPPKYKFLTANMLHHILGKSLDQYFVFTVVRNPWDRVVSFYHYKQQIRQPPNDLPLDVTFEQWIRSNGHYELPHQYHQLIDHSGKIHPRIDFMGRLENINNDWKEICKGLNIDIPLIHDKQSKHTHYRDYYTPKIKGIIDNYYDVDIRLLNYDY